VATVVVVVEALTSQAVRGIITALSFEEKEEVAQGRGRSGRPDGSDPTAGL
jgi:hypothetical protein